MVRSALLILNRKSAARPDVRAAVRPLEKELGIEVTIPWSGKQLRKLIRKRLAKGVTHFVAGGGDGTLNAVTSALLRCDAGPDVTMGLIPLGTANDFARSYGDDGLDLTTSLKRATTGEARPIDVGLVNGRPFVNVASGGFGAMITATTPKEVKKHLGGLAYTLTGLARLSELKPTQARISLDGSEPHSASISALVIGNNRYAGGGFEVTPDADMFDGLLDLGVLTTDGLLPENLPFGRLPDLTDPIAGLVQRSRFKQAVLETEKPFHLNLDGEPMVDTTFEISVLPRRLKFALPGASS
ncbi:YegS/Rv2252/BmrU family lipid kinase [Ruegeria arenilitoris]|uniref:YegS/Rv2252/BmrU family lipid kinase n=1 Tax=Ruegeria arenilitoris TaxID=1173585 RepID=UPI00147AC659|nr:YegS/Rv2252/BmrU family lipid kinase [Ruegeria arenilitoris]